MTNQNSEIEMVHAILQQHKQPMYFKELIVKALESKTGSTRASAYAIAGVHTQINMDSRFVHMGKGMWGLAEWTPRAAGKATAGEEAAVPSASQRRRNRLLEEFQQDSLEQTEEIDTE
ncbi:hypothetical protein P22_2584 [Propionispora sp. 2/2-37]|uniref:DNA-directed RNA polymerase subunit delta n=1 Tax=Propionispora sp. 2/2-37 TaxID=1677858 RepID=UPI0006BB69C2|nr:DNA-directed RNA polymerase subunit delta [Propionispora sp. 2/2-37]CUH96494.1 hypothetical protein P22_2584 [Propionispora sp. 2/2-37]